MNKSEDYTTYGYLGINCWLIFFYMLFLTLPHLLVCVCEKGRIKSTEQYIKREIKVVKHFYCLFHVTSLACIYTSRKTGCSIPNLCSSPPQTATAVFPHHPHMNIQGAQHLLTSNTEDSILKYHSDGLTPTGLNCKWKKKTASNKSLQWNFELNEHNYNIKYNQFFSKNACPYRTDGLLLLKKTCWSCWLLLQIGNLYKSLKRNPTERANVTYIILKLELFNSWTTSSFKHSRQSNMKYRPVACSVDVWWLSVSVWGEKKNLQSLNDAVTEVLRWDWIHWKLFLVWSVQLSGGWM